MDDHRKGIQADKPLPPWEQPGCFRMDCEPHRAELLTAISILGLIVNQVSMCLPIFLLIGMLLGMTTWLLAKLDLAKMSRGMMDPGGMKVTTEAKRNAEFALAIGIMWIVAWALFVLMLA